MVASFFLRATGSLENPSSETLGLGGFPRMHCCSLDCSAAAATCSELGANPSAVLAGLMLVSGKTDLRACVKV
jgi:hypothetical protein